jgi:hypothetical protein
LVGHIVARRHADAVTQEKGGERNANSTSTYTRRHRADGRSRRWRCSRRQRGDRQRASHDNGLEQFFVGHVRAPEWVIDGRTARRIARDATVERLVESSTVG